MTVRIPALAVFGLLCAQLCSAGQTLFYTGDPNNQEAIGDYYNPLGGPLSLSEIFEPFTVTANDWDINSVFFTELDIAPAPITTAEWSIRSGMAPGDAGVKIAGGSSSTRGDFGPDTTIAITGLDVILAPGTYWLNITPNSASGRLFAQATWGANSIDANLDGAALWYEPGVEYFSRTNADFSAGATGEVVPEPSTSWLIFPLAAATAMLLINRRRKQSYCAQHAAASAGSCSVSTA